MPMTNKNVENQDAAEPVAVTLRIEPGVYQAFLGKAQQAGTDVEAFLAHTLTVVLGCRAFDSIAPACAPKPFKQHSA